MYTQGSMFKGILAEDTKVYATTAANEKESSFGTYCDEDAVVDGCVEINQCVECTGPVER